MVFFKKIFDRGKWCTNKQHLRFRQYTCNNIRLLIFILLDPDNYFFRFTCLFVYGPAAPPVNYGLLIHEISRSNTMTHHSRQDSSGRVISSRRDLSQTKHNTHKKQTSMPPVRFEPTISAGDRPQTHTFDRAATGTGTE